MANAKNITLGEHPLNVLVYGRAGTGKTVFAGTFPKPLMFDFDSGILSLAGLDVEYEQFKVQGSSLAVFQKKLKDYLPALQSGTYKTIIIDSLTSLSTIILDHVLTENRSTSKTPGKARIQDYGEAQLLLEGIINQLKALNQLGINIVCIAHEEAKENEDKQIISIRPLITGKYADKISSQFDESYRSYISQKGAYLLQTKTIGLAEAKSRIDALLQRAGVEGIPKAMSPDYEVILTYAKGLGKPQPAEEPEETTPDKQQTKVSA